MEHLMLARTKCIFQSPILAQATSLFPPPACDNCQGHLYFLPCTAQYSPPSLPTWPPPPYPIPHSLNPSETPTGHLGHQHWNGSLLWKAMGLPLSVPQLFSGLLTCIYTQLHFILNGGGLGLLRQCNNFLLAQTALGKALRLTQKATYRWVSSAPFLITNCFFLNTVYFSVPPFLFGLSPQKTWP